MNSQRVKKFCHSRVPGILVATLLASTLAAAGEPNVACSC